MRMYRCCLGSIAVLTAAFLMSGCNPDSQPSTTTPNAHSHDDGRNHESGHEGVDSRDARVHADEGPHEGHLIELGRNHEYHAELVEDDSSQAITVYILDSKQQELAISSASISLTLTADGDTLTADLAGVGDDPTEGFSRFETTDEAIYELLEHGEEVTGKLRVAIDDTPYVGAIDLHENGRDHSTHDHD